MSFLLKCPNCGERSVYEYQYGGEIKQRPVPGASREAWTEYLYWRTNATGVQREWWFHGSGCRQWFQAERNATTNEVLASYFPGEQQSRR
jgi:heterotetrameric sarcosine oxidase delta subunit